MTAEQPLDVEKVLLALAAPFDRDEIKFKPAVVSGGRALALAYVDARVVMDRLDEVLGVANWQDEYEFLPDGACLCKLRVRIGGEWLTKMDVGGASEQPDEGDRRKAAVSDALKRAAVKFGVGRFLYRLPSQWCDYDAQKRQFARRPQLPDSLWSAAQSAAVRKWQDWLARTPNLEALNESLNELAELEEADKARAWQLVLAHAKRRGLRFDRDRKSFGPGEPVKGGAA